MLNIGTSVQLSLQVEGTTAESSLGKGVEIVPYFGDVHLAVMAGLNGGNVLMSFVSMVKGWLQELGESALLLLLLL